MYLVLSDHQELISADERQQLYDRVLFSMARFAHHIHSVRVHVSEVSTDTRQRYAVTISVETRGLVTVDRAADNVMTAVSMATDALETAVALRIGCRYAAGSDSVSNLVSLFRQSWRRLSALKNP
jgi:ribosome-associated translation inhibitor RaiA